MCAWKEVQNKNDEMRNLFIYLLLFGSNQKYWNIMNNKSTGIPIEVIWVSSIAKHTQIHEKGVWVNQEGGREWKGE